MNRDHLANERTFLAYIRTALAFVAFGFVIARFSLFAREISIVAHIKVASTHTSTDFGIGMALAGVAIAAYGSLRYISMNAAIRANQPAPMPQSAAVAGGAVVAAIGAVVAAVLFAFR